MYCMFIVTMIHNVIIEILFFPPKSKTKIWSNKTPNWLICFKKQRCVQERHMKKWNTFLWISGLLGDSYHPLATWFMSDLVWVSDDFKFQATCPEDPWAWYIYLHLVVVFWVNIPRRSKDETLPISSRESFTWIIPKTILCLVLDFQGIGNYTSPMDPMGWVLVAIGQKTIFIYQLLSKIHDFCSCQEANCLSPKHLFFDFQIYHKVCCHQNNQM